MQNCVMIVFLLVVCTIPLSRAVIYLATIVISVKMNECVTEGSHPRPTDIFIHTGFVSDIFERGNETIYLLVKFLLFMVFSVFGWCFFKFLTEKTPINSIWTEEHMIQKCIVTGVLVLHVIVGFVVTSLEIQDLVVYKKEDMHNSSCDTFFYQEYAILLSHHVLGYPLHFCEAFILVSIMLSYLSVIQTWEDAKKKLPSFSYSDTNLDYSSYVLHVNDCKRKYRKTYKTIEGVLKLNQTWFVLQWISYFFVSTADLTYALRLILSTNIRNVNQEAYKIWFAYVALYFLYELASFIIPYACGGLMNHAHAEFYDKMQEKIQFPFDDNNFTKPWTELTIEKVTKFDFVPHIPLISIDIPISSPGYLLSIVFDAFVLMITLITSGQYFWNT